ncbi:hypothetical protein ACVMB0_002313 [Bradyrhizobium sp. USDA 4451]
MYFGPSFTDLALQGEGITDSSPPKLTSAEVMSFTFLVHQLPPLERYGGAPASTYHLRAANFRRGAGAVTGYVFEPTTFSPPAPLKVSVSCVFSMLSQLLPRVVTI